MLWTIVTLIVVGAIAGFLARAIVPGRQHMGIGATILLGIVGSFVGGLLASLIFRQTLDLHPTGIIGSVIGAIIALVIYMKATSRRSVGSRTHV